MAPALALVVVLLCASAVAAGQDASAGSWLDQPLVSWNEAEVLPRPTATDLTATAPTAPDSESRDDIRARCGMALAQTPAHRAVEEAGWLAYDHVDRTLARDDLEIVAGMTAADAMCRPTHFQIFVFVGGQFAGTLSPQPMAEGDDGAAGSVRIPDAETITGEFARFGEGDAPCCPTSRVTVRYRIDRSGTHALVVPEDVRTTRGY